MKTGPNFLESGRFDPTVGGGLQRQGKLIAQMQGLKYATTEKCSPDTALRDIHELLAAGILKKDEGGGRSTSYCLVRA